VKFRQCNKIVCGIVFLAISAASFTANINLVIDRALTRGKGTPDTTTSARRAASTPEANGARDQLQKRNVVPGHS
jgi:hypothetical protein